MSPPPDTVAPVTLKSALGTAGTPLRTLLHKHLPQLPNILRADLNAQMVGVTEPVIPGPGGRGVQSLLGHAIEQRIVYERGNRFDFALTGRGDAVVRRFTYLYGQLDPVMANPGLFDELSLRLNEEAVGGYPTSEPILGDDPDRATRLAITLGLLDQAYRAYPVPPPELLMRMATSCTSLEAALALIDTEWVADVQAVSNLALPALEGVGKSGNAEVAMGPRMSGWELVGGADGDLLIDHTIVDVKAVSNWRLQLPALLRAFCYALLDVDDEHHITQAAVLLARHGRLVTWDVADVLDRAAGLTLEQARQCVILPLGNR